MIIHIVTPEDTVYSISKQYGVPESRIITDNFWDPSKKLISGQALIISHPCKTCIVRGGDTLQSIAKENNISVLSLLQNNPNILDKKPLPSQTLNLMYDKSNARQIAVAAYTGSATSRSIEKYLPYITLLLVQNAAHLNNNKIAVSPLISEFALLAKKYRSMPILSIECNTKQDKYKNTCMENILSSPSDTEFFINEAVKIAKSSGYAGIELNFSGISDKDKYAFTDMLLALTDICKENNMCCLSTLLPFVAFDSSEENIADIADILSLWNYIYDDNLSSAAPYDKAKEALEHDLLKSINKKLLLGIPTFGTDYTMTNSDYIKRTISSSDGIKFASFATASTSFDDSSQTPAITFRETGKSGNQHIVHYEDARSISKKLDLVDEYNLYGVNVMSLEYESPILWHILNQRYNILKY